MAEPLRFRVCRKRHRQSSRQNHSGIINKATADINKIAQQHINQVIRQGRAEMERIAPKIIKGAIEEVYKTPFRLLGNLRKKQFAKIKRKLFK